MDVDMGLVLAEVILCTIGGINPETVEALKLLEARDAIALVADEDGAKKVHWFTRGDNSSIDYLGATDLDLAEFAADPNKAIDDTSERFFA